MHKISIAAAVKLVPVSESTLRRDVKRGKVSSEKDATGNLVIDIAELERVYGKLQSDDIQNDSQKKGTDTDVIVNLLEERISELKAQLEKSEARESQLLELLAIKEKNLALATSERKQGFFSFLRN